MRTNRTYAIAAILTCAGSALGQTSWNNPAGGGWNNAINWLPMDVPNSTLETAVLGDLGGGYTVQGDLSTTILGLSLHQSATLNINAGRTLMLDTGGITNGGVILVNDIASSSNAVLRAAADFTITGTGRIELNAIASDLNDAAVSGSAGAAITIGAGQTVHGSGAVQGPITLQGLVEADRDGRDIAVVGAIDMSGGGTIRGVGGGTISLQGQIVGGVIDGGVEAQLASATINDSTSTGANGVRPGATLGLLSSGMTNEGVWVINTDASSSNAVLWAVEDATIGGGGAIELNAIASDLGDARLGGSATLTIGPDQTVRGSGLVEGPMVLNGTIDADRDGRDIAVLGAMDASGGGMLVGTNNGRVALQGQLTGGTLAGGVEVSLASATIDGSTSTGTNGVRPGSTLTLIGAGLTNHGTMTVNTEASFSNATIAAGEATIIDGGGNIDLNSQSSDLGDARLESNLAILTVGAEQSITGSGFVTGSFIIDGTINADRDGRDIAVEGALDLKGGGTLMGTNNGRVALRAAVEGGTLAGGVEADLGTASVSGSAATGSNGVRPGATLTVLGGGLVNQGVLTVNTAASFSNATVLVAESAVIEGPGAIDLNSTGSDLGDARLTVADTFTLTIGADQAVTGSGFVTGTIVCDGLIHADRTGRDIAVDADVDLSGGGAMQGTGGGLVAVRGAVTGGQWLGGVEAELGTASVSAVTMNGVNGVRPGSTLSLDAAGFTNDGTFVVNTVASFSDGVVTTTDSCTVDGSGELRLNAASSDYGDAEIRVVAPAVLSIGSDQSISGRGRLSGDIVVEGTFAPGAPADETQDIQITGHTTLADGSTTDIGIAGTPTTDFDRIVGTGTLTLDGTLVLSLLDGFVPAFEDEFLIADVGTITEDFDAVESPTIGLGVFRVVIGPDTIRAVWTCQADLNGDGILDFFDVQFFLNAFAEQALYGDYNEDGVNNFFDVQAFLNDFSAGCL